MPLDNIAYKSFCWCLGTTSFRTKNFNRTIEEQLELLSQFWAIQGSTNETWHNNNKLQADYYRFLQERKFVDGNAPRPDKDAREKTSGLVDIGLIAENRTLTEAGKALLAISHSQDFASNNILHIDKDSFIYLKQLLKTHCRVDTNVVRPFIVLLKVLLDEELQGYITKDEFMYILPLCVSKQETDNVIKNIKDIRKGVLSVDEVVLNVLMRMNNYQKAQSMFLSNPVSEELICAIGLNRKSRDYDKPYYPVYQDLHQFYVAKNTQVVRQLLEHIDKLNLKTWWKKFLFTTTSKSAIIKDPLGCTTVNVFSDCTDEAEFKKAFFNTMHLLKAKATLYDYYDLNKRYLSTADVLLFDDEKVSLDVIPKHFFSIGIADLYRLAFIESPQLGDDCDFSTISPALQVQEKTIVEGIEREFNVKLTNMQGALSLVEAQRYRRLNALIDKKFRDDDIIKILDLLDKRDDATLMEMVTDNADAPTIFEYILGILWYKISERKGKILDYLKLSLDTNLLPKSHAAGGEADIVYEYEESKAYPAHCLLLEATLADKNNQRRMEMEPVSRHMGAHLLEKRNPNSYCIFATTSLNPNVISDFRLRKEYIYYDVNDTSNYFEGLKIIPLRTKDLCAIIQNHKTYSELYAQFENAYKDDMYKSPIEWWEHCIRKKLTE